MTTRFSEITALTSARETVTNSSAGEATKNAVRDRMMVAAGPSAPDEVSDGDDDSDDDEPVEDAGHTSLTSDESGAVTGAASDRQKAATPRRSPLGRAPWGG